MDGYSVTVALVVRVCITFVCMCGCTVVFVGHLVCMYEWVCCCVSVALVM